MQALVKDAACKEYCWLVLSAVVSVPFWMDICISFSLVNYLSRYLSVRIPTS